MASSPQQGESALHSTLRGLGESLRHHQRDSKVKSAADFLWSVSEEGNSAEYAQIQIYVFGLSSEVNIINIKGYDIS